MNERHIVRIWWERTKPGGDIQRIYTKRGAEAYLKHQSKQITRRPLTKVTRYRGRSYCQDEVDLIEGERAAQTWVEAFELARRPGQTLENLIRVLDVACNEANNQVSGRHGFQCCQGHLNLRGRRDSRRCHADDCPMFGLPEGAR